MSPTPPPTHLRVHQFAGLKPGPRLLVSAAVHGNEVAGVGAIQRVMRLLDDGSLQLLKGTLTMIPIVNPLAHRLQRREGDRNLNRNLRPTPIPQDFEDRIANQLCPWLAASDVLLDLHSFNNPGPAFAMLGPRNNDGDLEPFRHQAAESALAMAVGTERIVEGWLSTYALGLKRRADKASDGSRRMALQQDPHYGVGTTEYMRSQGGYGITLECGQHEDPQGPEVAFKAIVRTLVLLGMVAPGGVAGVEPAAPQRPVELLQLYEVIDREHVDDRFERAWASFDPIAEGERIGTRADGTPVLAPSGGRIVFPNSKAEPGNEWFYLAKPSDRVLT
ncbi:Succinylglutamate desuccinylase / Aspartoacylase family protein [Roseateles sp. YR242]|uniref:succinylglutamate desuccinylase/aspartoacylase family protein n=1 Tax=Roseateles sp. YR242 TaxID=1855305 RepID=UPI0008CAA73A|nr:succinylglutamate desuccinylase/aspartoacylase family protein [Roseateles sp. YR242]SEL60977.1 Succinylglutamate desuccinylase / Aspartoacylase family protein [Roseateles sp. YR242]